MNSIAKIKAFINQEMIPGNGASPFTGYKVFRAYDNDFERNVVVKYGGTPKNSHLTLKDEYEILLSLDHVGIIKPYGYGWDDDGVNFIIFPDYPLGGRRCRWREIIESPYFCLDDLKKFTKRILNTLEYLRSKNLMHMDVELANIVAFNKWEPVFIDFGRVVHTKYTPDFLLGLLHPKAYNRINAWVREICGIGGRYEEEGAMKQGASELITEILNEEQKNLIS